MRHRSAGCEPAHAPLFDQLGSVRDVVDPNGVSGSCHLCQDRVPHPSVDEALLFDGGIAVVDWYKDPENGDITTCSGYVTVEGRIIWRESFDR